MPDLAEKPLPQIADAIEAAAKNPATTGVMLYAGNEYAAYTYVGSNGHIGPLAVTRADVLGDAFTTAMKMAAAGSSEKISAFLPGTCDSALSLAVNQGMRITFPMLLMQSGLYVIVTVWCCEQRLIEPGL